MMNATTQVGTITDLLGYVTVKAAVLDGLGDSSYLFNVAAITEDYRAEIDAVAPSGLVLVGGFIIADASVNTDNLESKMVAWRDAIEGIDFRGIVARHNNTKAV